MSDRDQERRRRDQTLRRDRQPEPLCVGNRLNGSCAILIGGQGGECIANQVLHPAVWITGDAAEGT